MKFLYTVPQGKQKKFLFALLLSLALTALLAACTPTAAPSQGSDAAPAAQDSDRPPNTDELAESRVVKIAVAAEGMYRIPLADLSWDEAAADTLALTWRGQPVPYELQITPEGAAIIFYGQSSASRYTPRNVYLLQREAGESRRMPQRETARAEGNAADYVLRTLHLEENHLYKPTTPEGDTWHWAKIIAPGSETLTFDLPALANAPAALRVSLWGATRAPVSPAHHLRLYLNEQQVAEAAWDGQTWQQLTVEIPAGVLQPGTNRLEIRATGEVDALLDIVHLNWVEVDYPQPTASLGAQAIFRAPGEAIQLRGWTGTRSLYEIGSPTEISRLILPAGAGDSPAFQADPDKRYIALSEAGYLAPQSIQPLTLAPDLRALSGADYLAIGHPSLLEPLTPLLEARQAQGLATLAAPLAAVYDQFNAGMAEPEAIRAFLRYAAENWDTPPRYVLLVGDASYDFYGYQTPLETAFVPTLLVPTVYGGETASDVALAQLDDDLHPDLAIGRLPARTPQQVTVFVEKTLAYEQTAPAAPWNRAVLGIADGTEPSFAEDARRFVAQFPAGAYQTEVLSPAAGAQDVNLEIAARFGEGAFLAAYFGHGSVNLWGKDALLTSEEAAALQNGTTLPIVLNFTCLTGLFTQPDLPSLAESLLLNPQGGAVAVLAPTSPTLPSDQSFLSDAFAAGLRDENLPRLGDVTLAAWRQVPTTGAGATDVMLTFLLFGDPALRLP